MISLILVQFSNKSYIKRSRSWWNSRIFFQAFKVTLLLTTFLVFDISSSLLNIIVFVLSEDPLCKKQHGNILFLLFAGQGKINKPNRGVDKYGKQAS